VSTTETSDLSPLELERVMPMAEASAFTTLSEDTLGRRYAHLIVRLSPRRRGMRVRSVLAIANGTA
jgi:hypothetical protein